jgi:hypothetical protein
MSEKGNFTCTITIQHMAGEGWCPGRKEKASPPLACVGQNTVVGHRMVPENTHTHTHTYIYIYIYKTLRSIYLRVYKFEACLCHKNMSP